MPATDAPAIPRNEPVYWFVVLESARRSGDFARAAEAQRELERLGIKVRYGRERQEGCHA